MSILTKTLNALFLALLLGVTGLFLATLFPMPGNLEAKIVQSGSMTPAIPVGALIAILPSAEYQVGDVITFGEDTKTKVPTTHRIVEVQSPPAGGGEKLYRVKGDANEEPDNTLVSHREVIGKVVLTVPYAGFVLDFARQPLGFALLIGLPALIVILDELANIYAEVKRLRLRRRTVREKSLAQAPGVSERGHRGLLERMVRRNPRGYADMKSVDKRVRISDDMFVRTRQWAAARPTPKGLPMGALVFFAAAALSGTVYLGSVGGTLSYFSDTELSLGNELRAGEWETPALLTQELFFTAEAFDVLGTSTEELPAEEPPTSEPLVVEVGPPIVEISSNPLPEPPPVEEPLVEEPAPEELLPTEESPTEPAPEEPPEPESPDPPAPDPAL